MNRYYLYMDLSIIVISLISFMIRFINIENVFFWIMMKFINYFSIMIFIDSYIYIVDSGKISVRDFKFEIVKANLFLISMLFVMELPSMM